MQMYPKNRMLTMEQELVVSSIRVYCIHDGRMQDLLRHDLNWSAVRQSALYHHVLPLLYTRLKTFGGELVPPEVLSQLKKLYRAIAVRNLRKAERPDWVLVQGDTTSVMAVSIAAF